MAREFTTVGVVGLGTMGAGIVEVFARNGLTSSAVEPDRGGARARPRSPAQLHRPGASRRGKLTEADADACSAGCGSRTAMEDLADVDLVIEAVPGAPRPQAGDLRGELDKICRPDAILATNTSSLSVTEISVATTRPSTRSSACTSSTRRRC